MEHYLSKIETPAFVVNESQTLKNISKFQSLCDEKGLTLGHTSRPIRLSDLPRLRSQQEQSGSIARRSVKRK